jgi:hypothetical protein
MGNANAEMGAYFFPNLDFRWSLRLQTHVRGVRKGCANFILYLPRHVFDLPDARRCFGLKVDSSSAANDDSKSRIGRVSIRCRTIIIRPLEHDLASHPDAGRHASLERPFAPNPFRRPAFSRPALLVQAAETGRNSHSSAETKVAQSR